MAPSEESQEEVTASPVERTPVLPPSAAEFDYSKIDPEKEWMCFGTMEPEHTECQECPDQIREKCAKAAGRA